MKKIEGIKRFGIVAKVKDAKKMILKVSKKTTLRSSSGAIITLDQVCDISIVQGASFIKRENLSRYIVLSIEVDGRDVASFVEEADKVIKSKVNIPEGYFFILGW